MARGTKHRVLCWWSPYTRPMTAEDPTEGKLARSRLVLTPIGDDPQVGLWLAALEDGRTDTLKELDGVTSEMVD